ncbi:MAG: TCP-1/cpn60 chaperonin family protein, partial [Candidatus Hydrothermarchaeota archaeon]
MEEVAAGYGVPKGEALRMNILGAIVVAEAVRSTLGPGGMDKMLVGEDDPILTDKGAVILSMLPLRHPGARMAAEVALAQDREVGDGTATAVVLLGELLKRAEALLGDGIHPSVIARGYSLAMARGLELLSRLEIPLAAGDLERAAHSMLEGKAEGAEREHLASLALEAVAMAGSRYNIKVEYRVGGSIMATELVKGIVIDLGKRTHPAMPRRVNGAKILLIDREFEVKKGDIKIQITDPAMLGAFGEYKKKVLRVAAEMVRRSGANVLLCQRNMDPLAMSFLAQAGILAVRDIPKDVMEALASATGAKIVSNVRAVEPQVLGSAELVEERKVAGEEMLYILCREPKAVSILVRAGTERGALETKRRMEDLVAVLANLIRGRRVVAGAGAP